MERFELEPLETGGARMVESKTGQFVLFASANDQIAALIKERDEVRAELQRQVEIYDIKKRHCKEKDGRMLDGREHSDIPDGERNPMPDGNHFTTEGKCA